MTKTQHQSKTASASQNVRTEQARLCAISQGMSKETAEAFAAWIGNKCGSTSELLDCYFLEANQ